MRLSKKFLESGQLNSTIPLQTPPADVFSYPEKVLQFGTGVLQRGLCDFYIDKANRAGIFKGRVVVCIRIALKESKRA
jgi:tagaturonate reductase